MRDIGRTKIPCFGLRSHFKMDNISEISVFDIFNDSSKGIPKCCPNGFQAMSRNHPEICIFSNSTSIFPNEDNVQNSPLNCIAFGKTFNTGIEITKEDAQRLVQNETEFCIDEISTKNNTLYSFTCGEDWPYNEFSLQPIETYSMGIPMAISVLFIIFTIASHLLSRKRYENLPYYIKLNMFIGFLCLMAMHVLGVFIFYDDKTKCSLTYTTVVLIHGISIFFAFTWMTLLNISTLISFWRLRSPIGQSAAQLRRKLIIYNLIGWGWPVIHFSNFFTISKISWPTGQYCIIFPELYLAIVDTTITLINLLCFSTIFVLIMKYRKDAKFSKENRGDSGNNYEEFRESVRTFIKLVFVSGVLWSGFIVEAFVADSRRPTIISHIFRASFSLQGVIYFFVFGLNKRAFEKIKVIFKGDQANRSISTRKITSAMSHSEESKI